MTDNLQARIADAEQARAAMDRWLGPAFDEVIAQYVSRYRDIVRSEPWAADKLKNLTLAQVIAEAARAQIEAVVRDGEPARAELKRSRQIEGLSAERRKVLGITV